MKIEERLRKADTLHNFLKKAASHFNNIEYSIDFVSENNDHAIADLEKAKKLAVQFLNEIDLFIEELKKPPEKICKLCNTQSIYCSRHLDSFYCSSCWIKKLEPFAKELDKKVKKIPWFPTGNKDERDYGSLCRGCTGVMIGGNGLVIGCVTEKDKQRIQRVVGNYYDNYKVKYKVTGPIQAL